MEEGRAYSVHGEMRDPGIDGRIMLN